MKALHGAKGLFCWMRLALWLNWTKSLFSFHFGPRAATVWLASTFLLLNMNLVSAATWHYAGNLQKTHRYHTATLLANGKILVVGGTPEVSPSNGSWSTELYDPGTDTWTTAGAMSTTRHDHTATRLSNGKVLIVGGDDGSSSIASAELYDPTSNTWSPAAALARPRAWHTATLLPNGKVLVAAGGWWDGSSFTGAELATAELYDPASNTWSVARSLSTARYSPTATLLATGKVLVAGGTSNSLGTLVSTELYDPSTNTWMNAGSLSLARTFNTATLLTNGTVLVAGGSGYIPSRGTTGSLTSVELYNPVTNAWSTAGALTTARNSHTATLLSDGKLLVAGGTDGSVSFGSAELYDSGTNTWIATNTLHTPRYAHTATLQANGKVLVAGGCCFNNATLSSTEIYDPSGVPIAPGAPTSPIAVGGRSNATVTFTAPASDGGSGVVGYLVTSIPAGGTDSNGGTTALSHVVTGLNNGTSYSFTVTASNAAGESVSSSVSNIVRPAAPPSVPMSPTAVVGDRQALVTFTAPIDNGGSPIAGYQVWSNPSGGIDNTMSTALTHTVVGLINGQNYVFTVTARNSAGTSANSSTSNSVTPIGPPVCTLNAAPSSVTSGVQSQLTANCTPAVTSYTWTGGTCAGTTASTCTVTPSATTTYSVAGVNAGGTSAPATATVTVNALATQTVGANRILATCAN